MTDINLMHWLGAHTLEVDADADSQVQMGVQEWEATGDRAANIHRKLKDIPNRVRDALRQHSC